MNQSTTNTSIDDLRGTLNYFDKRGELTVVGVQKLIDFENAKNLPRKAMLSMLNSFLRRAQKREKAAK